MENKFKVGDLIRGTDEKRYSCTDTNMTKGKVTEVYNENEIEVEILEHKTNQEQIGSSYRVNSKYFELIDFKLSDLQFADILTLRNGERYVVVDGKMQGENSSYSRDDSTISVWYNDDLTQNEDNKDEDIVKVERAGQVIYERQDVLEVTMEEVCKKFGQEVKIVKGDK